MTKNIGTSTRIRPGQMGHDRFDRCTMDWTQWSFNGIGPCILANRQTRGTCTWGSIHSAKICSRIFDKRHTIQKQYYLYKSSSKIQTLHNHPYLRTDIRTHRRRYCNCLLNSGRKHWPSHQTKSVTVWLVEWNANYKHIFLQRPIRNNW